MSQPALRALTRRVALRFCLLAALALTAVVPAAVQAQASRWTGAVDSRWAEPGNWTVGVPNGSRDAVVVAAARAPVTPVSGEAECRNLLIEAGAALTIPTTSRLLVNGSADARGTVSGDGVLLCIGSGVITGVVRRLRVDGGRYTLAALRVDLDLELLRGGLVSTAAQVAGAAVFRGGTLEGPGLLHIGGDATFTNTAVVEPPDIRFTGATWTADALFRPHSATVTFAGVGAQTAGGTSLWFNHLVVGAGSATAAAATLLTVQGNLDVDGRFTLQGDLHVQGDTTVGVGGVVDLGTGRHVFSGNVTNNGQMNTAGTARFDQNSTVRGTVTLAGAEIDTGAGTVTIDGSTTVTGQLVQRTGTLQTLGASTVHVLGDATFSGGTLARSQAGGVVDVDGAVTFAGTSAGAPPDLRCGGDWRSDAAFAPQSGVVELDGAGTSSIDGQPMFAHLVIRNGTRVLQGGVTIGAMQAEIEGGSSMICGGANGGGSVRFQCFGVAVGGLLAMNNGTHVEMDGGSSVGILAGGTFELQGTASNPSQISGFNGGGYSLVLGGTIKAQNFVIDGMGPTGVRILATATLAPAPDDFRGGILSGGAASTGAALLDVAAVAPLELHYLTFLNNPPTATYNVRSLTQASVRMVNCTGAFTGGAFEDDPNQVIDWVDQHTALSGGFQSRGVLGGAVLRFTTTAELDTRWFRLLRATDPLGPFTELAGSPLLPQGGPVQGASYELPDPGLSFPQRYYYRLEEELTHGPRQLLGSGTARAFPAQAGTTVFVGPGGFGDIAAGIAAAPPGGTVVVTRGSYAAFRLDRPVTVRGDGSGPVRIDAATGPVRILGLRAGDAAGLADLEVVNVQAGPGVEVTDCGDAIVVLDRLRVAAGSGHDGILLHESRKVAIQDCRIAGDPGLRVRNESTVYLSGGAVDVIQRQDASRATYAGVVPGRITPGVVGLPGTMPALDFDPLVPAGGDGVLSVRGDAGAAWLVMFSLRKDFRDLSPALPLDMVLLLDPTLAVVLTGGVLPVGGTAQWTLPVPDLPQLWGTGLPMQALTVGAMGAGRFANVRDLLIVP